VDLLPLVLGKSLGAKQRRHQRSQRALTEPVSQRLQAELEKLLVADKRPKTVRPFAAITLDAPLCLQPLQELLHGRDLGIRHFLMDGSRDFAAGGLPTIPKDLKDRQFPLGDLVEFHDSSGSVT
jgi:hypothetical protein